MPRTLIWLIFSLLLSAGSAYAELAVHFMDVGQGGAVLLRKEAESTLYDCGDVSAGEGVVEYLKP